VAETDARRAEEETARAHDDVVDAQKAEEKRAEQEKRERERAERVAAETERARKQAEDAARARDERARTSGAANVSDPGITLSTGATGADSSSSRPSLPISLPPGVADRPEILAGAAFAGAFIVARILKRLFD
jgi:hypothetical protein